MLKEIKVRHEERVAAMENISKTRRKNIARRNHRITRDRLRQVSALNQLLPSVKQVAGGARSKITATSNEYKYMLRIYLYRRSIT